MKNETDAKKTVADGASECCSSEEKVTCCDPSEKSTCCGPSPDPKQSKCGCR
jgi:hypothetical protein